MQNNLNQDVRISDRMHQRRDQQNVLLYDQAKIPELHQQSVGRSCDADDSRKRAASVALPEPLLQWLLLQRDLPVWWLAAGCPCSQKFATFNNS